MWQCEPSPFDGQCERRNCSKIQSVASDLAHKTEAKAVAVDLPDASAVRKAAVRMLAATRRYRIEGLLVQRMVRGIEVLGGGMRDTTFGPLLVVGAGGVQAELLADTASRPLPVTQADVTAMLGEVRVLGALNGFHGTPPADVQALVSALLGVARLAQVLGDRLVGLDVNPIIVSDHGAFAVDLLVETGTSIHGERVAPFDRIGRRPSERRAR